jgi:NADH-quinone oxidoreductase subunit N
MISPILLEVAVLIIGAFLLMYEAFADDSEKRFIAWAGIAGLALVLGLSFFTADAPVASGAAYWNFYRADFLALFFKRFALLTTIVVLIMALEYQGVIARFIYGAAPGAGLGEFYALPVFTCAGLMWMASAVDFVLIFVSLELVTISFYILVSYMRRNSGSLEAGVKYLILGALSTGFLVYGITWIFGVTGETNLDRIVAALPRLQGYETPLLFGLMLVLVSLGFKVAAVPFQLWVPDVYQGAPTPITAFLSVGSKAAGFIVLVRVVETFASVPALHGKTAAALAVIAGATLIYGNLAALPQNNLKRLLAYSSIAHAGYLLVAVASIGAPTSGLAISFYLAGYLLMTLLAFIVMIVVSNASPGDDIAHFNGLGKRAPWVAFVAMISMLSLAGVPFTAGFFGKLLVFDAAIQERHYALVVIGIVTVAAGFYYYLKLIRAMYWQEPASDSVIRVSPLTTGTMVALAALILILGIYPQPIFQMLSGGTVPTRVLLKTPVP